MQICDTKACTGCGACEQSCPKHAISMQANAGGFLVPVIDEALCVECLLCQKNCHVNKERETDAPTPISYAACVKDRKERLAGSSGAIVTALARTVFDKGGAVVGAVFDENQHLYEDIAYSYEEYVSRGFARSKYVQSRTGDCFLRIKERLQASSAPLLFVGTPCLISALKSFLRRDYEQLFTVDFVCHGVPSPGVFDRYCRHLEKKYRARIKKVEFRMKKPSWAISSTVYAFENGKKYKGNMLEDAYNVCFAQHNNSIRESCFDCHYATKARTSDITLCDYWGHREVTLTDDDDRYGVSAVMPNTEKGKRLFGEIAELLYCKEISYDSVTAGNERLYNPHLTTQDREGFFSAFESGADFDELAPYCRSYFEGKSWKSRFMARHNYAWPFRLMRRAKKLIKK